MDPPRSSKDIFVLSISVGALGSVQNPVDFYHPPTKLREGNVFTNVYLFNGEGVGISGPRSLSEETGVGIPRDKYTQVVGIWGRS